MRSILYRIGAIAVAFLPCPSLALIVHDPVQTVRNALGFANQVRALTKQLNEMVKQSQMLQQQLRNQQDMISSQNQMTKTLSPTEWEDVTHSLMQLDKLAKQGNGMSYAMSDISQQFETHYPGYQAPENYPAAYQQWSGNTLDSIQGSFAAAGLQHQEFAAESAKMEVLQQLSQHADGQTQAIQAGNLIATSLVVQLQKLRQLQMSQIQAQNAYMAYEVNKDSAEQAALDRMFRVIEPKGNHPKY